MDLLYNRDGGVCLWLGMMSPEIKGKKRNEILNAGLSNLNLHAQVAILWKKDANSKNLYLAEYSSNVDEFVITSSENWTIKKVEKEIRRFLK